MRIVQNHFFPNNMGMTICVDSSIEELEVEFSFGLYYQPQPEGKIKLRIDQAIYKSLMDESNDFPFKDILEYNDGFLSLSRSLKGKRKKRTEEYEEYDIFRKAINKPSPLGDALEYFDKLIGRIWKRKSIKIKEKIKLDTADDGNINYFNLSGYGKFEEDLKVGYYTKIYNFQGKIYIKILLVNRSEKHSPNNFNNKNEKLNRKCLFQSKIVIYVDRKKLCPYKSYRQSHPYNEEEKILNFQYRDLHSLGIGHNCAAVWSENQDLSKIETSFIPEHDVNDIKNDLKDYFKDTYNSANEILDKILKIRNLSIFSGSRDEVIEGLKRFADLYGDWIEKEKSKNSENSGADQNIGRQIIDKLVYNYERIKSNIQLLKDDRVFRAFQFTNTAMLIQLIISNDETFSKKEKHLAELIDTAERSIYRDFNFFETYDFSRIGFEPEYRPFQLAFLLLNIDGIVEPRNKSRNNIVDLIWFPTGGGKTEAYLALAAFSIIWRCLINEAGYEGTSVIMRYTLRLLTTQQFERASRLICSLEFLRRRFEHELKSEPITIGLWVGMGTTPNKIKDAIEKVEEIRKECERNEDGRPEEKNVFQVSSCPWCGTRIISKFPSSNTWEYGFDCPKNKIFKIHCLNEDCPFSTELPVQVVDEMLYRKPPTLLFATVDKFATLAFREEGHAFFNSLNQDKMPPDLIIQDELHLLSGPLGSITGIFESVIELLSTRNGIAPKIIAATATTRNTDMQISQLYGGREVNIFPPSGLDYRNSFFASESSNKGRRKYIGFLPTGKTGIDTQLQMLAHLLAARVEAYIYSSDYIDDYWTILSYYNSLKDVGKTYNKIGDEVSKFASQVQIRLFGEKPEYTFNYRNILNRTKELTSRVESYKVRSILDQIEKKQFKSENIEKSQLGNTYIKEVVDLVLATNMISVGIDISRLNIMLINGMPRNTAEYIQASSRIGRKKEGLVITLFDANKARDKSYFEHFVPFHQAFYKRIEPLSVTPFTENTIEKMIKNIMIIFVRHKVPGMNVDSAAKKFEKSMLAELKDFIKKRFHKYPKEYMFFENMVNGLANNWLSRISSEVKLEKYSKLLKRPNQKDIREDTTWVLMESLREIDTSTYIQIKENFSQLGR
ncbi:MAG: helicase [Candidatus Aminicenantes bacterium]|nr:helicase [Candidatus Aminicenantes bacterium]NIM81458.1 helicase [Candidatus Aminicenantes bacterium]NIN23183.1 helicase [Candidatus Aminicenantes bacterium]NIN44644.1 helicase [Candidatus Aminicenantes bacterium]NIN87460.1 helicase [Candidatus Aminicenantes bacterium]